MTRNRGSTSLHRKRRPTDPMRSFDALPAPLRRWLSQATLTWSSDSARRLWAGDRLSITNKLQANT